MATFKAYAKINWILNIVGVKDGFHMLDGVMETVGLYDLVTINVREDHIINASYKDMETMPGDLCKNAAKAFYNCTGIKGGADIYVEKHIPIGAGLGGGSSDCTCVLCYLNEYYGRPLSKPELMSVASDLGADMAFFVDGGAQRARGKGEVLSSIDGVKSQQLVIARPKGEGVSTPAAFKLYDSMNDELNGDVDAMIAALKSGDAAAIAKQLYNSLEKPSMELLPAIAKVKASLIKAGAVGAVMTGSGSAVIGIIGERDLDESMLGDMWYRICDTVKPPREKLN